MSVSDNFYKINESFYLLSFLPLLIAKGLGLYDGQFFYNFLLIIGAVFFLLKIIVSDLNILEWTGTLVLLSLGLLVYHFTGEKGILLYFVMMLGVKNVSLKKIFKWGAVCWSACFLLMVFLTQSGIIEETVFDHPKHFFGYVICHGLGYSHPNVTQISYVVLTAFLLYIMDDLVSRKELLIISIGLMAGNAWLFLNTFSYTGATVEIVYILLNYLFTSQKLISWLPRKSVRIALQMVLPFCVIFSILGPIILKSPVIYSKIPEIYNKINDALNTRYDLSYYFLTEQPLTAFGSRLIVPNYRYTMDCSYVYLLVQCGYVTFAVVMIGFALLVHDYIINKKTKELAIIFGFCIAGISEPFLFNSAFKNLIFLFLGEFFFRKIKNYCFLKEKKPKAFCLHLTNKINNSELKLRKRTLHDSFSFFLHHIVGLSTAFAIIVVVVSIFCKMFFPFPKTIYIPSYRNMDQTCTIAELSENDKSLLISNGSKVLENHKGESSYAIVSNSTLELENRIESLNIGVWSGFFSVLVFSFVSYDILMRKKNET